MDLVEQSELLAVARQSIAEALADLPTGEVGGYEEGFRDGQCAAYVHALALLGVGE